MPEHVANKTSRVLGRPVRRRVESRHDSGIGAERLDGNHPRSRAGLARVGASRGGAHLDGQARLPWGRRLRMQGAQQAWGAGIEDSLTLRAIAREDVRLLDSGVQAAGFLPVFPDQRELIQSAQRRAIPALRPEPS